MYALATTVLVAAAAASGAAAAADRPNILMFAVDDLRPLFGKAFGHEEVLTPNLDRFLEEGLVFRNSYVQIAVCGPR
jgi:arylsulfatase A-like enzyme